MDPYTQHASMLLVFSSPWHIANNTYFLFRFAIAEKLRPYLRALKDAISGLPDQVAARKRVQESRSISTIETASLLTWSPLKLMQRKADIRPIRR